MLLAVSVIGGQCDWAEGGTNRILLHVAGGALLGGLGGGSIGSAFQGAAGAGQAAKMADELDQISKGVASATGSELLGNLTANVAAGLGGALVGGTAGPTTASNVELYNQSMHRKKDDLVSQVCPAGVQCSDAVLNAAIQAQGENAAAASENMKTAAIYGVPATVVVALGPEAVTAAVLAGVLNYGGSLHSYRAGLSNDNPTFTGSYVAGIVGGLAYPFAIADRDIYGMSLAGKVVANTWNAGVVGIGAFGTAAIANQNPDLAAGISAATSGAGVVAKTILPGLVGVVADQLVQGAAGPIQNAIEASGKR